MRFIKPKKKRLSKKLKRFLKDNNLTEIYTALRNTSGTQDYFDFSTVDKSKISYLKGSRIPEKTHLIFNKDYRKSYAYHTSVGKLISGMVDNAVIVNASKAFFKLENNFEVTITSEICKYYLHNNYSKLEQGGSLYSSCMRHRECQAYISVYEDMGADRVQLAVILDKEGGVLGRALLWHAESVEENRKVDYLDRVYAVNDNIEDILYQWARDKKMLNYENGLSETLHINYTISERQPLPYFDTFYHYGDGVLSTSNDYCNYELRETCGETLQELGGSRCDNCDELYNEDDLRYCEDAEEYRCEECCRYSEYYNAWFAYSCNFSSYEDTYFPEDSDDFVWINGLEDYILCDHAMYDEETDQHYTIEDYDTLIAEREAELETVS